METFKISLSSEEAEFVREQVESGTCKSVNDYFRFLIREAQARRGEAELEALLLEGLESGPAIEMTESDWDELRRRAVRRRAS